MAETSDHCCGDMSRHVKSAETAILYEPKFREYGIQILDGGSSYLHIIHCPWCGHRLPESLRDRWFETLEKSGLEADDPSIPKRLLSDEWWREDDR